ncbi:MAG: hypothetical protein K2M42_07915 [Oscillospiraceae bacterium]|nr:hypothetical protein [Oscillospiraceae bacterium]
MKRKIYLITAVLALLLLAGCSASPAGAGESEPPSPSASTSTPADAVRPVHSETPAYYAAYAEIVRDYQQQYGPECIQQIYSGPDMLNYLMGVCVIRLIDFDLDGTQELMLCWPESEMVYHSYCYAIWTSPDGQTAEKICENKILDGVQYYNPFIKLVSRADGVFLGEDISAPDASETHVYRGVSPSGLSDALTLGYEPPYGEEEQYLVNGQSVSGDAYAKAESDFLEGAEVTRISFVLVDFEDSAPLVEAVRATQDALRLLGIEPNETGLDIIPFDPEQVGYTPYLELIDQYLSDFGQPQILSSSRYDGRNNMPALGGLCVVRTADLDGDGTDELILAYAQSFAAEGKHISYGYGIWTLRDGAAQELIRASIPGTAYEPCMMFYAGQAENYTAINYDTNTEQVTSIANVEYEVRCYGYNGEGLVRAESLAELPGEVRNNETERIYFSANSYRWAAGMDWDVDSQRVLSKTLDTINLLRSSY